MIDVRPQYDEYLEKGWGRRFPLSDERRRFIARLRRVTFPSLITKYLG